jgi:ribonuclease HI
MKKKHLRALSSIENWLQKQNVGGPELAEAVNSIRHLIEGLPDDSASGAKETLPPPVELAADPLAVALFSDGGCRGNPGPGAYAFVIQDASGALLTEGVEFEAHTTNNKMELSGPLRGLSELRELLPELGKDALLTRVKVVTDSKYVVDGMKSWVHGWKARGWKKADGKTPENLELWQELDRVRQLFLAVDWVWVRGHGGHPQNEYCDRKANGAMDENGA